MNFQLLADAFGFKKSSDEIPEAEKAQILDVYKSAEDVVSSLDHYSGKLTPDTITQTLLTSMRAKPLSVPFYLVAAFQVANTDFPPKNKSVGGILLNEIIDHFSGLNSVGFDDQLVKSIKQDPYEPARHMGIAANKLLARKIEAGQPWYEYAEKLVNAYADKIEDDYAGVSVACLEDLVTRAPYFREYVIKKLDEPQNSKILTSTQGETEANLANIFAFAHDNRAATYKDALLSMAIDTQSHTYGRMLSYRSLTKIAQKSPHLFTATDIQNLVTDFDTTTRNAVNLEPADANQIVNDQVSFWKTALNNKQWHSCAADIHASASRADNAAQQFHGEDYNWGLVLTSGRELLSKTTKITALPIPALNPIAKQYLDRLPIMEASLKQALTR